MRLCRIASSVQKQQVLLCLAPRTTDMLQPRTFHLTPLQEASGRWKERVDSNAAWEQMHTECTTGPCRWPSNPAGSAGVQAHLLCAGRTIPEVVYRQLTWEPTNVACSVIWQVVTSEACRFTRLVHRSPWLRGCAPRCVDDAAVG